ncbi:MAG: lytic transglycosylase domain-containing protein, partial [Burkholderiales bacterium]
MSKKLLFILTMCATSLNVYSDESAATFILLNNYNIRQSVDVWSRMRAGFKLAHKQTSRVKYFEKFYTRNPKAFNQLMANARPYLYYILTQTERNGLPSEIALIPAVESSFNPLVSNPTDAYAGMWQFVPSTGKRFNLQQNENIDERRDIVKSTTSALNYLTYLHGIFGQWEATIGAYNWGEGNMYRAILKAGAPVGQIEYADLHLRQITADYVPKIIALASIIENPAQFGVKLDDFDNQPYFAIVNPTATASVNNIIQKVGLDNKTFTKLNPQFKATDYLLGQADRILLPLANQNIYYAKQGGNLSKPTASLTSTLANPNLQVASNQLATSNQVANLQLTSANQGSAPTLTSQQDTNIQASTPIDADTPATYRSDVITTTVA